ncbi:MAG: HPr-rel-A system PqqD family peptide chaperone [Sphingobium sp.]
MTAQQQYRAEPDDALIVRALGDLTLIYHRPAGQTHLVISPVPEILAALREAGGASAETLRALLARAFDLGAPQEAVPALSRQLEELSALGLVREA